jgi:DNA topoisomerase-1
MNVVIVESPAKAKTINKYLGSNYTVLASYGHVRDLPSKDGSVDPDKDFAMKWATDSKSNKRLADIASAVKSSDKLFLATDPDREGEAIAWHVLEILKKKKVLEGVDVKRVAFNEITKSAILKAMAEPRDLDQDMVDAYLARRALDYLVGFTLSPVLWRKLPGSRSAGRVQSVALRLVCEREMEIEAFNSEEYWSIPADFKGDAGKSFEAKMTVLDGDKLKKMSIQNADQADGAKKKAEATTYTIQSIEKKPKQRRPYAPFTTSTLQQEASRKLGFNAQRTMSVAQSLYEGKNIGGETVGLITYMRTDGVSMAMEAVHGCRKMIEDSWGDEYRPEKPNFYKNKSKNAQEAHEAVRPTDMFRRPSSVKSVLDQDEQKLYDLIWKRAVSSQMSNARMEQTSIEIAGSDGKTGFRASGSVQMFDGFLKLYQEGRQEDLDKDGDTRLPQVKEGESLSLEAVRPNQHFTEPPARFSEASLVKKLEELGIGRPSTYASILTTLRERNYVRMERNRFIPEDRGKLVTAFLENFFQKYVEYDFTANLEEQLDGVSEGKVEWKKVLHDFWGDFFEKTEEVLGVRTSVVLESLNEYMGPYIFKEREDGQDPRKCNSCDDGRYSLKVGRYGAFIGCSNYPECNFTRQIGESLEAKAEDDGPKVLGTWPENGEDITIRDGRFGPYIQVGEMVKGGEKPKRGPIPRDMSPADIDYEKALQLLSLPRPVGNHPETGEPIIANIGRYGPYLQHEKKYAKLSSTEEVFNTGLNRAVTLLAEAKGKSSGGSEPIKDLGKHPEDGEPIKVMGGRYGPYVKHGKTNATLPRGTAPENVTLEEAVEMIKAKVAKGPAKKKGKAAPKKKPAAKKKKAPAKKKAAAKK